MSDRSEIRLQAECVVATVYGDTYGLTEAEQLEAIRLATAPLRELLKAWEEQCDDQE